MPRSLEAAIARLVADAKANNLILKVAPAAERLAREHTVDARVVAQMITNYAIHAHVNLEMTSPGDPSGIDRLSGTRGREGGEA